MGISGTPSALTPEPSVAWGPWTPTLTNITLGNGTVTAKFTRVGLTVHWRFKFVLGSTSAVGTTPQFTLPVAMHADYVQNSPAGEVKFLDAGSATYHGNVTVDTTAGRVFLYRVGGSGSADVGVTATAPFTWTTSDMIHASGTYEAAA